MPFLELYEVFLSLHVSGTLFSLRLILLHQNILSQRKSWYSRWWGWANCKRTVIHLVFSKGIFLGAQECDAVRCNIRLITNFCANTLLILLEISSCWECFTHYFPTNGLRCTFAFQGYLFQSKFDFRLCSFHFWMISPMELMTDLIMLEIFQNTLSGQ